MVSKGKPGSLSTRRIRQSEYRPHHKTQPSSFKGPVRPVKLATREERSYVTGKGLPRFFASPWAEYKREAPSSDGAILASSKAAPFEMVLIQRAQGSQEDILNLTPTSHPNIVQLQRVYWEKDSISLVYEPPPLSLKQLLCFRPSWGLDETASLSKDVLSGLEYIHSTLGIAHGSITECSITLMWNGQAKLGSIGQALLSKQSRAHQPEDFRSLAGIVLLLTEPTAFLNGKPPLAIGRDIDDDLQSFFYLLLNAPRIANLLEVSSRVLRNKLIRD